MVYIPDIVNYKPFYIQQEGAAVAKDTTEWGLIAKSNPYPLLPNPKEPYKNEWKDENGDDEWCDEMHYEAIEMSVSFYIKAYAETLNTADQKLHDQMDEFFAYIRNGKLKIYDSYTGIGRGNVRYAGYEEKQFIRRKNWASAVFEIRFKINDPITRYMFWGNTIINKI